MKLPWQILTIVAMAVVILALIFFPKSCREVPKTSGNLTPDQENILNARITVLEHYSDSLLQELDKSKASGKAADSIFKIQSRAWQTEIKRLKTTQFDFKDKSSGEIDSLIVFLLGNNAILPRSGSVK